ncbi:MAG: PD-(D/E)XK nuclease family protein [Elusimicrobia bacterium]|nr:PD-(D/E)XK nuclease family protein [Elusimicrobiota bacterium]
MPPSDPFLSALADICRAHKTRRKILLLPNPGHGVAALERLARSGFAWANVVVRSPAAYAAELLAGWSLDRVPMPEGVGPALVALILSRDVPKKSRLAGLAASPGASAAVWRTIRDVRLAGLTSKDLDAEHFLVPQRWRELKELLAAYETFLVERGWYDEADLLREASAAVKASADLLLMPSPLRWSALERAFLKSAGRAVVELPLYREGGLASMPAALSVFRGVSQEAEAREIARRILEGKVACDAVEVAVAGPEYDRLVLAELFEKAGIPVTLSAGLPVGALRPGKALLGYLAWAESGFEAGRLEKLLRSGVLTLRKAGDGLSSLAAARALARFSLYRGIPAYGQVFGAHEAELAKEIEAAEAEGDVDRADAKRERLSAFKPLRKALEEIVVGAAWAKDPEKVGLLEAVAGCRAFLARFAAAGGELDNVAITGLTESLGVLSEVGDRILSVREACALIRETALSASVAGERARPGRVHLTSLDNTGWEGRPLTFVTGLTLGNHPGRVFQDPFLLDDERGRLSPDLATSVTLQKDRAEATQGRLASLEGEAVVSAYAFDSREGREAGPAPLFLHAARKATGKPELAYKDLALAAGDPIGLPAEPGKLPVDDLSWWLASGLSRKQVDEAFPWAADGKRASDARSEPFFGVYDGSVPSAAGAFDPTKGEAAVSSTYMADLAACPFRFFLKRVLSIKPKDDEERSALEWLTPMERGDLLHQVYAAFLRGFTKGRPDPRSDAAALLSLLDAQLAEFKLLIPPATEALYETEREEMRRDAMIFLERTAAEWDAHTPVGREVSFGMPELDGEPLSVKDPVEIKLGRHQFRVHGRVDRLDKVGDQRYEVVDYKTGSAWAEISLPAAFQPVFYLKAAETLLKRLDPKAKAETFSFLYSTRKGGWTRVTLGQERVDEVAQEIPALLELLAAGQFRPTSDKSQCERCPFADACGDEPWERAKALFPEEKK